MQKSLIFEMHNVLDQIYSNTSETFDSLTDVDTLKIAELELSDEPIKRAEQLVTRFSNLCTFLQMCLK